MAVEALRRAVTLDPESSFPKYITLGQLTAGEESLKYLTKGIELLKKESPDDKRGLSKAYCNIGELYMTDLCQVLGSYFKVFLLSYLYLVVYWQ